MNKECMGIINLSENDYYIKKLAYNRPIASIPIGGRYRVIDFVLSNMVNSGIQNVGIFSDEKYRSLLDHLGNGKSWDLNRKLDGLFVFSPNVIPQNMAPTKKGDIYNIYSNIDYIKRSRQKYVLIAPSYMICNIDYENMLESHKQAGSDVTVAFKTIYNANEEFVRCNTVNIGKTGKVLSIGKNMGVKREANICLEMYILEKDFLLEMIYDSISTGEYFYINDLIHGNVRNLKVTAYEHKGYLSCVNSVDSYFKTNMDFLNIETARELFYEQGRIFTKIKDESPAYYSGDAVVENSLIANGCIINGTVKNSVIFRRVKIEKGAVIENSIIMQNGVIKKNAKIKNAIFDKNINISEGKELKGDPKMPIVVEKNTNL